MKHAFPAILLFVILLTVNVKPAHAYLDPASGSMILQVIVAAVAAVLITLKAFWHRIRGMFGSSRSEPIETDENS